jgi:hypothetical protein
MLSTLGGAPMVEQIVGEVAPEPVADPGAPDDQAAKATDGGKKPQGSEPAKDPKAAGKGAAATR